MLRFVIISSTLRIAEPADEGVPIHCHGIIVFPSSVRSSDESITSGFFDADPIVMSPIEEHNAMVYLDNKKVLW